MRGIGKGQTIHLYIIPEIERLMARELKQARTPPTGTLPSKRGPKSLTTTRTFVSTEMEANVKTLVDVAAWLVINSMHSERIQFNQLCIQNVSNVWRKKAFKTLLKNHTQYLLTF